MTPKHSPTPWRVTTSYDNGEPAALTIRQGVNGIADLDLNDVALANRIVTEHNSHAALVEACQYWSVALARYIDWPTIGNRESLNRAGVKLTAALALATATPEGK
jgi:hypothetical protein